MSLARFIDHTVLKNTTTHSDVDRTCHEAMEWKFAAVCIPPYFVADARSILQDSAVKVATVIGFPFGYHAWQVKLFEAESALMDGADELDVVMNLSAFFSNDLAAVESEISDLTNLVAKTGRPVTLKVIIESGILSDADIVRCCALYRHYPVQFLKTSTGYAEKGASVEAVRLMRQHLPPTIQIKASGGIRTAAFAQQLVDAGATRLGCSASVAIVRGETGEGY